MATKVTKLAKTSSVDRKQLVRNFRRFLVEHEACSPGRIFCRGLTAQEAWEKLVRTIGNCAVRKHGNVPCYTNYGWFFWLDVALGTDKIFRCYCRACRANLTTRQRQARIRSQFPLAAARRAGLA